MAIISGGTIIEGARLRANTPATAATGASNEPVGVFSNAGAPTVNVTLLGTAVLGTLLVDTTNAKLYICTATNGTSTITWTVVGTQT